MIICFDSVEKLSGLHNLLMRSAMKNVENLGEMTKLPDRTSELYSRTKLTDPMGRRIYNTPSREVMKEFLL